MSASSLKNEIHKAGCALLDTLKLEADGYVQSGNVSINYARDHWYREFNKRKTLYCSGSGVITPHDGGFRPTTYSP